MHRNEIIDMTKQGLICSGILAIFFGVNQIDDLGKSLQIDSVEKVIIQSILSHYDLYKETSISQEIGEIFRLDKFCHEDMFPSKF